MAAPSVCFVSTEIFPGTPGGIGRLIQQSALALEHAGWPAVLLLDVPEAATEKFRAYARSMLPRTSCVTVAELLTGLATDDDIPLWAFHFPEYWRSYRVALALRRLLADTRLAGIEFPDYCGLGYVALKWRRLLGGELGGLPMWIRLHAPHELCIAADDRQDDRIETRQLHAMERYSLRHADGWVAPSSGTLTWLRGVYGFDGPGWVRTPPFERVGSGGAHRRHSDRTGPIRILFYGKLQRLKGTDLFVRAAVDLCQRRPERFEFDLVGPEASESWRYPSFRVELEALIPPGMRDRFHFHGAIEPSRLRELALSSAIAVVPSRIETFCLAAHELNWIGIPLVLNDLPAFADYFRDGENCRTFDGTAEGLRRVLDELLSTSAPFAVWRWSDFSGASDPVPLYREVLATCRPAPALPQATENDDAPRVSVIVPYYEMQAYVDTTIASVARSTYRHWEVIVVDDGSRTPEARAKLEELRVRFAVDSRVQILSKPNGGLGSARNHGIAHAAGRYILPLDSDDLVHPDYLACAVTALEANPELDAVSCYVSYFTDGHDPADICDYVIPYDLIPPLIFLENRAGVAASVFRRSVFERHHYDEDLFSYEDWDLWWQLAAAGRQVETLPRILFRYRRRADSMVNTVGYSRHAHLIARIAERHREALAVRWDEVFRLYLEEVARLRARCRALDEAGHATGYGEETTGHEYSVRLTGRLLLGLLRSRVRARLAAALGRRTVTVRLQPKPHPEAQGMEVWCAGVRPVGGPEWRLDGVVEPAPLWERRNGGPPGAREMLVAMSPGATMTFRVGAEGFGLGFLHHPWSGRVVLTVDGQSHAVDLFGRGAGQGFFEHFWTGYRWVPQRVA